MRNAIRYYLDTEFIELPERQKMRRNIVDINKSEPYVAPASIILLSIGLVDDTGREYYAVNTEADCSEASQWVKDNVLAKMPEYDKSRNDLRAYLYGESSKAMMPIKPQEKKTIADIKKELLYWTGQKNNVPEQCEFWGYFADYDWVVFCWIFGTMMDLPKGYPMFCKDLKQLMETYTLIDKEWKDKNCPDPEDGHNALVDAKWNKKFHKVLLTEIMKGEPGNAIPI